jgi:lipoprotein-anchoring transpeptidase ErfK/SrfK
MTKPSIVIDTTLQSLELNVPDGPSRRYPVSTSKHGVGEVNGSFKTPRGRHQIRAKIGTGCPAGTVFIGRRPTGEIYADALARRHPERDWILTRILWLSGLEPGRNRFGDRDTMRRYIYIHGMPDSEPCGIPGSIGCIRMRNADIVALFDRVNAGTAVLIL